MPKQTTFRLPNETDLALTHLSSALELSRTAILASAVEAFVTLVDMARADAEGILAVLLGRYGPDAEVTLWVSEASDGLPLAHVRVGEEEPAEIGARAILAADGQRAHVFLDVNDCYAELLIETGPLALRLRPRFPVGELPWPPRNFRIVIQLKDLAPTIPSEVAAALVRG